MSLFEASHWEMSKLWGLGPKGLTVQSFEKQKNSFEKRNFFTTLAPL